jgi:nicotinamide-nucleotide amidase
MTCAVLSIGTELTRGELVNSNSAWLAAGLTDLGFEVVEHASVDDDRERIVAALERLASFAQVIVCTGGLGPTTDDLTTAAVASALRVGVVRDEGTLDHIRRRFERLGRPMSDSNAKQADFPEGATVLVNPIGTAAGFEVSVRGARAFFMPGVPSEMKRMFDEQVVPRIRDIAPNDSHQIRLRTFGLPESVVGEKLDGVEEAFPGVTIGYRAHFPEIEVKVLARAPGPASRRPGAPVPSDPQAIVRDLAERAAQEVRMRLGDIIYGEGEDTFAGIVGRALRTRGWTFAIAESCTGGLVGHMITKEPGASDYLLLDAVTYANSAKQSVLGVDEDVLRGHGAVSAEVAGRMAEGARRVSGADIALAITGIAGPGGGSDGKPVGLVYLAIASAKGTDVKERTFKGDRLWIQTLAAYVGLAMVRDVCSRPGVSSSLDVTSAR